MPGDQCFRIMVSYILSEILVVSGGRINLVPDIPSFYKKKSVLLCFNYMSC